MIVHPDTDTNGVGICRCTRTLTVIGGYTMLHTHTDTNWWVYDDAPGY